MRTLSQLGGASAVALVLAGLIVAAPVGAEAAARPAIKSFTLVPPSIGGLGGTVTVTAKVKLARTCAFSINPRVARFPLSEGCAGGTASAKINVPENPSTSSRTYSVKLTVTGAGGKVLATKKIVEGPKPLTGVAVVVGQEESYCALLKSGRVDCWGANNYGQLGNGTTRDTGKPTAVRGVGGVSTLAGVAEVINGPLGYGASYCAVLISGGMDCWGYNLYGELGNGTTASSRTPTKVKAVGGAGILAGVTEAVGEDYGFCARLSSGAVVCWGQNAYGNLGDGTFTGPGTCNGGAEYCSTTPVKVVGTGGGGTLAGVSNLVGEVATVCALLTTHDVDCWGYGPNGQLGDGTEGDSDVPAAVKDVGGGGILSGVSALTSDDEGTNICARLSSGTVDCWGDNTYGELGNGTSGIFTDSDVPVAVKGLAGKGNLSGVADVVGIPGLSNCAILASGGVDCWGYNGGGELGNGSSSFSSDVPTRVLGIGGKGILGRVGALTGGAGENGDGVCARLVTEVVACWGDTSSGYSAVPKDVAGVGGKGTLTARSVSASGGSNCAVQTSGGVDCWGSGFVGQLGDGTMADSLVPEVVVAAS